MWRLSFCRSAAMASSALTRLTRPVPRVRRIHAPVHAYSRALLADCGGMHQAPMYGQRKPQYQRGAKLEYVADLLAVGNATIEETLMLLQFLRERGFGPLGVCGSVESRVWSAWLHRRVDCASLPASAWAACMQ